MSIESRHEIVHIDPGYACGRKKMIEKTKGEIDINMNVKKLWSRQVDLWW